MSPRRICLPPEEPLDSVVVSRHSSTPTRPLDEEFVQLFTKAQRRLYLYILAQIGNVLEAEEVLQETNTIILAKHEQYEPGTNFQAWAMQIATYEILKSRQRKGREKLRFSDEFLKAVAEESQAQSDRLDERRAALEYCLKKLRAKDRKLIQNRYRPGTTAKDLAAQMGRPANSVYQSLGRIRRTLLECVNRRLSPEGAT